MDTSLSTEDLTSPAPNLLQETPPDPSADGDPHCKNMIVFQLIVFVLFYASLFLIIIFMYIKYRRECKEMEKNQGSEANFRMVKRLMEQYDQK